MGKFLSSITLLIILIGCSEDEKQPNQPTELYGSVSGIIYDLATVEKISGASINTDPPTINSISDSAGNYTLNNIPPGQYQVIANKLGYIENYVNVLIEAGQNVVINIPLNIEIPTNSWQETDFYNTVLGGGNSGTVSNMGRNSAGHIFISVVDSTNNQGRIYRMVVDDLNWLLINNGLPNNLFKVEKFVFNSVDMIFVDLGMNGIYWTSNSGLNWEQIANYPEGCINIIDKLFVDDADNLFIIRPDLPYNKLFKSVDMGNIWIELNGWEADLNTLAFISVGNNNGIYVGTNSGKILRSTDNGQNWELLKEISGVQVIQIISSKLGNLLGVFGNDFGIYLSTDIGWSWNSVLPGNTSNTKIISTKDFGLYVTINSELYRSTTEGRNWFLWNEGLPPENPSNEIINITYSGSYIYCASNVGRVYRRIP
jgi:hypothetical protein